MPILTTLGAACARAWGFTSGLVKDQYFNLVSLLLPGNGTNGAQNNTFLDGSSNNFTITRNGNTTQGTFSPFSQTGWGNYFNNSGTQYLTVPSNAAFSLSATSWTIEFFVFPLENAPARERMWINRRETSGAYNASWQIYSGSSSNAIKFFVGSSVVATSTSGLTANQWNHVAVVWNGTTLRFFINGTQDATTASSGAGSAADTQPVYIGQSYSGDYIYSYISNLRIVKGVAVYTGSFTVPITPLAATQSAGTNISAITGTQTSLLTCQSNRFIDNSVANSGAGFTITANGGASVTPFSPFAPTQSYSAAAVGGSGYFDGTGDYLEIANNSAFDFPADFTVEAWVYCTSTANAGNTIMGKWATAFAWAFYVNPSTGAVSFFYGNNGSFVNAVDFGTSVKPYTWAHIAITRQGTDVKAYVNGTQVGTTQTISSNLTATSVEWIGRDDNASRYLTGYISNIRVVKGQALSTGNFTPPSAPVTASAVGWSGANAASSITGTVSLVANFTNAGVVDATAKNVLETVGNAQISTTQSKWGGGSMYFDGNGDYCLIPSSSLLNFQTGNFVIEMWFYIAGNSSANNDGNRIAALLSSAPTTGIQVEISGNTTTTGTGLVFYNLVSGTAYSISYTGTISQSSWHHLAIARSGTTTRIFLDGTSVASGTLGNQSITSANSLRIGATPTTGYLGYLNGYIDDLRFTNGNDRGYTGSTITVPSAPFPVQ